MALPIATTAEAVTLASIVEKETGVASIPVSVFYNGPTSDRFLRFCFAKEDETMEKATEKLMRL